MDDGRPGPGYVVAVAEAALIFSLESHAHANTVNAVAQIITPAVLVPFDMSLSHPPLSRRLDQYVSLLGPLPPPSTTRNRHPLLPPVLIRSWNLWRTHIRDVRPICVPTSPFQLALLSMLLLCCCLAAAPFPYIHVLVLAYITIYLLIYAALIFTNQQGTFYI